MQIDNKATVICLKDLVVFRSLRIGPVEIKKDKISAVYCLETRSGEIRTNELIYHYGEEVFTPGEPADINLASMIVSQVALNYGLFCERIIFDGLFDHADIHFLRNMMENTSREIFVMKFLHYNPFLTVSIDNKPGEINRAYTAASIDFMNTRYKAIDADCRPWETDKEKYCVLSSGGKDSLLTYGILEETGREVHPVFINESGRHWFTSLNAFRYLKIRNQHTAKVWCNSDRIFNWMVRYMPFIRKDFLDIRSDEYPVRLWTVAVFVFSALPLLKKRKIGGLLIGNEYDTTDRKICLGIRHYNGLYDQSRYFDLSLTEYYHQKKWNLSQFSILRSLSELLIVKILGTRYPHLQENQVSCHAAHPENGCIYPCGKCEKCRRIVSMMLAVDLNPERCGYSEKQVQDVLVKIQAHRVNQIESDARHLYHLLIKKGIVEQSSQLKKLAKSNPPTLYLRFDYERSLLFEIPSDLRKHILKIYLEYADGALAKINKNWERIQPVHLCKSGAPV